MPKRMHQRLLVTVLLLLITALAISCTGNGQVEEEAPEAAATATTEPQEETASEPEPTEAAETEEETEQVLDEVTVVLSREIPTMDPQLDWTVNGRIIYYEVFGYLALHSGSEMELQGELAESWEWIDDRTVQFNLRQGVQFHNGEPFNAEAVKYSLERILDPETEAPWIAVIDFIEEIEVIDEYTVQITSKEPYPGMVADVGRMSMVPPNYIEENGSAHFAENPVGTGPFKFVEFVPGERIVLERNMDYWRGPASIERLIFKPVPEAFTRVSELLSGQADIVTDIPAESIPDIESSDDTRIVTVPSIKNVHLGMNTFQEPLDDVNVRQAIAHAINVDSIVENVLSGYGTPVEGILSPLVWGVDPSIEGFEYDPDRARELLTEAGYEEGDINVQLTFGEGRAAKLREVAEAVSANLAEVGIIAEVTPMEWGVWSDQYYAKELDGIWLEALTATIGDPDQIFKFLDSERVGIGYHTPELDELITEQRMTVDEDARLPLVHEVQQYVMDDVGWVPMYDDMLLYGSSNRIEWEPSPSEIFLLWSATPRE